MRTTKLLFIGLAVSLVWNCAKTDRISGASETNLTITASLEDSKDTKTTLQDAGTGVYWEAGDEIKVFYGSGSGRFASTNKDVAKTTNFTGIINTVIGSDEGFAGGEYLWGLYPYRSDATYDGSSVSTTLPDQQTGKAGSFGRGMNISLAKSSNLALSFYNVCGGLRFSLTRDDITEVIFEGGNNENLAGKIKLIFSDGIPVIQELSEGQKQITLAAPDGGTFKNGKWYYIIAATDILTNGFKMTFNTASQYAELIKSDQVTIKRGIFGSLEKADEGLSFTDRKTPSGNIVFKDNAAKYACITKFDTDQDGELSYGEAAAVTDISGLFANWGGVKRFDELKYFTSLTEDGMGSAMKELTSLRSVTIPPQITYIPWNAFDGCSALDSVTIMSKQMTKINPYAFNGCESLESLELPSGIEYIWQYSFYGCKSLKSINLPSSLITIGNYAFSGCGSLTSIDLPSSLLCIGSYAFSGCSALTSVSVPNNVTSFYDGVFSYCTSLVSASLPDNLSSIPEETFSECYRLKDFSFPENITSIGTCAFWRCSLAKDGISKIEIPSSVTSIGAYNFDRVRNIIFTSPSIINLESKTYGSFFGTHSKLYVPAGKVDMYKAMTNWAEHADYIFPSDSYKGDTPPESTVDMGTDAFWATCNLGASVPEDNGDYFAWGETEPYYESLNPLVWKEGKSDGYAWTSYKWCNGTANTLTKYCTSKTYGTVDNKIVLEREDDAASMSLGGNFCIPTWDDWFTLCDICNWRWTSRGGHKGYEVTSPDTGNSIFLPAAGFRHETGTELSGYYDNQDNAYWASTLSHYGNTHKYATCLEFNPESVRFSKDECYRCVGFPIRPISY